MKRIFAVLVAAMLLTNMLAVTAFADETAEKISIDVYFDNESKEYDISGTVEANRGGIPMTLLLIHENNSVLGAVETVADKNEEGDIVFVFPKIPVDVATPSGKIYITVSAGYVGYVSKTDVDYNGVDKQLEALKAIKAAIDSGDEGLLESAIADTKEELELANEDFFLLSDKEDDFNDAKSIALKNISLLKEELEDLPESAGDDDSCSIISEHVSLYRKQYKEAVQVGKFFESTSSKDIRAWYDANEKEYNLSKDNLETEVDDTMLEPYFDEMVKEDGFVSRMPNINHVITMAELNYEMKIQAVLYKVAEGSQIIVNNVITELSSMLSNVKDKNGENTASINFSDWAALSKDDKGKACIDIAGSEYDNLYLFIKDVNTAIENAGSSDESLYQPPSSTGSNRGGKGGSFKEVVVPNVPELVGPIAVFEDIEDAPWAEQAIRYLYSNRIIAGKDEKTFAPNDRITRAEFAKMLVLAFKLEGENDKSFTDINADAWYAQYVWIAASNGLILGDGSGRFNPDMPVSRQDAAVMMYRAIGTKAESKNADVVDYSDISPYAINAVNYMFEKGIVNGVGDGKFAPHSDITRASAAKMLYLLLV